VPPDDQNAGVAAAVQPAGRVGPRDPLRLTSRSAPGPLGELAFEEYLLAYSTAFGTSVWDVATGERLLEDEKLRPLSYHPASGILLSTSDRGFRASHLTGELP